MDNVSLEFGRQRTE